MSHPHSSASAVVQTPEPIIQPIYSSVLATLPNEQPIPVTRILARYHTHDRQLAAALLVATSWGTLDKLLTILPWAEFPTALSLLSAAEQERILTLIAHYLRSVQTPQDLALVRGLNQPLKQKVWQHLTPAEQRRIQQLTRQGGSAS